MQPLKAKQQKCSALFAMKLYPLGQCLAPVEIALSKLLRTAQC